MRLSLLGVATLPFSVAFVLPGRVPSRGHGVVMSARSSELSRADVLRVAGAGLLPIALMPFMGPAAPARAAGVVTLPSGLQYEIVKEGDGPTPNLGELAAIRFKGSYNGVVFDNLIDSKEPYYFRVGGGNLLKGIEEAVPLMKVGSTWKLTIPGDLAFGRKGRPASPGKPRIPSMATINYELQLVSLPGREPELIDLQPFDEDAPASDDSAPTRLF